MALGLGILAIVLQVIEWFTLGFGPADGGYASIYFGWTAFIVLFGRGAIFWLETTLATSLRYREHTERLARAGRCVRRPVSRGSRHRDPLSLVPPTSMRSRSSGRTSRPSW